MASNCMLCGKKLGFFAAYGEDVLTGDPTKKICFDCMNATDIILRKIDMKIPFEEEDFSKFSEEGRQLIDEYIKSFENVEELMTEQTETESDEERILEVGDAVIERKIVVDNDEAEKVFKKLSGLSEDEVEDFLDGLISDDSTAEQFMNSIKELSDDELKFVMSEQRELYNNAEWAYIMLVESIRNPKPVKKEIVLTRPDDAKDEEIARMKEVYADYSKEELTAIYEDGEYTYEARAAAKELLGIE